ncbi:MAG: flavodoxin [Tissierellia bacterium]|nr:flavodoxin [Tissierellia bacterium]
MKISVLYFSEEGSTKTMAETIVKGMVSVEEVEAKSMSIDDIDRAYLKESSCVVIGTPTHYASMAAEVKSWLDTKSVKLNLGGKLAGAFATAGYIHGGADIAIQNILTHMTFLGMLIYSGGSACGKPPIHLGPVAISSKLDEFTDLFEVYGQRMASKAKELF